MNKNEKEAYKYRKKIVNKRVYVQHKIEKDNKPVDSFLDPKNLKSLKENYELRDLISGTILHI